MYTYCYGETEEEVLQNAKNHGIEVHEKTKVCPNRLMVSNHLDLVFRSTICVVIVCGTLVSHHYF